MNELYEEEEMNMSHELHGRIFQVALIFIQIDNCRITNPKKIKLLMLQISIN